MEFKVRHTSIRSHPLTVVNVQYDVDSDGLLRVGGECKYDSATIRFARKHPDLIVENIPEPPKAAPKLAPVRAAEHNKPAASPRRRRSKKTEE